MIGAPMPVKAVGNERVYLKITGSSGTFGVTVRKLDKETAIPLSTDDAPAYVPINPGEMLLLKFDAVASESYTLSAATTHMGGISDKIETGISVYSENSHTPIIYKEGVPRPEFATSWNIPVSSSGPIFIVLEGAYWWDPNEVKISVQKN
jgi:hypothetical protein